MTEDKAGMGAAPGTDGSTAYDEDQRIGFYQNRHTGDEPSNVRDVDFNS